MNLTIAPKDLTRDELRTVVVYWLNNADIFEVDELLADTIHSWDSEYTTQLNLLFQTLWDAGLR